MFTLSLQQLLVRAGVLLLLVAVHGWAVAAAAVALGDRGPAYDGRRTLDPFAHLDLLGGVGVVLFSLGWIRPVAVDPKELRSPRSAALVALAGIAAVAALVLVFRALAPLAVTALPGSASNIVSVFLSTTIDLGLWFALVNLLPIPPLTGGLFLLAVIPELRPRVVRVMPYAKAGLALLVVSGLLGRILAPLHRGILQAVLDM